MSRIFCLVGKSGSGKDTMYTQIMALGLPHLRPVIPCTTRPRRTNEADGQSYHFVSPEELARYESAGQIIEKREYMTTQGLWTYFTPRFHLTEESDRLLITTLEGVHALIALYGSPQVQVIYLYTNDRTRLLRCIERESREETPDYAEVCRRFLADQEDFSAARLKQIPHLHSIDTGNSLALCLEQWQALYQKG
ncbi:guanylate kinase [Oscillospiraceae bacterium 50-16]